MSRGGVIAARPPAVAVVPDPETNRALDDHRRSIEAVTSSPAIGMRVLSDIEFADGIDTPVAHGLGRRPTLVTYSCVRGAVTAGTIEDVGSSTANPATHVVLRATGYGATVTANVAVF